MRAKTYTCDDCGERGEFTSYVKARGAGWAISRDYKSCYCPECAPVHRLGGANGRRTAPRSWLPKGFEQLSIDVK
ncbi:MAG: hypothetical protein K2K60_01270 [Clostridia bacterium]|nr:hypothetical protein [Clostridia bacterium]